MKPMTPMDARRSLDYAEEHGSHLDVEHRRALETIAGMRTQYAIELQYIPGGRWQQVTGWSYEPPLDDGDTLAPNERIKHRYVVEPGEA